MRAHMKNFAVCSLALVFATPSLAQDLDEPSIASPKSSVVSNDVGGKRRVITPEERKAAVKAAEEKAKAEALALKKAAEEKSQG